MSALSPLAKRNLDKALQLLAQDGNEAAVAAITRALRPLTDGGGTTIAPGALPLLGGDLSGRIDHATVIGFQGRPAASIAPSEGQSWVFRGGVWTPGAPGDASGLILDYSSLINEALTGSGATATASSSKPAVTGVSIARPPISLVDNDEGTYWASDPGPPGGPYTGVNGQWAKVDLGSAKAITYFRVGGGLTIGNGPPTWKLQSSTDNSTWTDRFLATGDTDTGIVVVSGGPITARYWRILATAANPTEPSAGAYWAVRTLALYSGTPIQGATGHAIQDEGTNRTQRAILDFQGAGVTVTDDSGDGKTVVTIPSGSGHTIEDEGTPLTARTSLNFVGAGVTATDAGGKTVVTIPGTDVYATDAELTAAIEAHEAASDPHPGYLTPAEFAALFTAKGDMLAGTGSGAYAVLPAPAVTGYYLRTDPTQTTGLRWVPLPDALLDLVLDGADSVLDGTDRVVAE